MTSAPGSRRATTAPRRSGRLVAGVLSLVLLVAVACAYLVLRDGNDPSNDPSNDAGPAGGGPTDEVTDEEAPDPLDDPMSPESIDLRYDALAGSVTTGSQGCRSAKARKGQEERLVCDAAGGTLELVTYETAADLTARRDKATTDQPGNVLERGDGGILMGFEAPAPEKPKKGEPARPATAQTFLFADDKAALQSAWFATEAGTKLNVLVTAYAATDPSLPYPMGPTDKKLVGFARRWARTDECLRIPTVNPGAVEENYCDVPGPVEMFVGRFDSRKALDAYRAIILPSAVVDDREVRTWARGTLYEYRTDDGTVSRYWDDPSCLCYAEAFLAKGTYPRLETWWSKK